MQNYSVAFVAAVFVIASLYAPIPQKRLDKKTARGGVRCHLSHFACFQVSSHVLSDISGSISIDLVPRLFHLGRDMKEPGNEVPFSPFLLLLIWLLFLFYFFWTEKIYAKASLLHEGQKLFKRKTNLQSVDWKYTVFNEALLFRVPEETLKQSTLRVSLNRYNVVGRSSTIGEVIFGPSSSAGPESTHWWDMLARPDKPVSMWHTLHGFTFMEGSRDTAAPPSPS